MAHRFTTVSVCPECAVELPADIVFADDGMVCMEKRCDAHGEFWALVERDQRLYALLRQSRAPIYPGHFIDATTRCNLNCSYCYHPNRDSLDRQAGDIVREASLFNVPIHFIGGEPTLRQDLPDILRQLQTRHGAGMATNCIGLLNMDYLKECLKYIGRQPTGEARFVMSFHLGQNEKVFYRVMENIRELDERISGISCTLLSLDDLPTVLNLGWQYRDLIDCVRVHVATDIWQSQDHRQIFMSDILKYLAQLAGDSGKQFEWIPDQSLLMWTRAQYDDVPLAIVRWQTRHDIDLPYTPSQPTYRTYTGEVAQLVHGFILNDAWERGWCKGRRVDELISRTPITAKGAV